MEQASSQNKVLTDNVNCFNYSNSFNVSTHHNKTVNINNQTVGDKERQILEWLSPLDPRNRHHGVSSDRIDGIGNWLLEIGEFRKWRSGEVGSIGSKAVLFCCGNPGVGKTYLSSLVIDGLCKEDGKERVVAGLYCDFLAQNEQTPVNMLGAVLRQLVGGEIPDHVQRAFQKAKKELGGRRLGLPDLVKLLKTTTALLLHVYICIDALDELPLRHRQELLESLRDIIRESPGTRILFTARPHIQDEIKRFFAEAVTIPISPAKDDIKTYLEMRLDRDPEPNAMDRDLRADILRIIPESICEIFLLVSLSMDAILDEITIYQRRRKLLDMAKGNSLGDAYSTTLARMKAQKWPKARLGLGVLMWVSHAERPLKVNELRHALGVEIGDIDLNAQNIPSIQTLLSCSLGLITVEESSSTIRLIHLTLQEYLCRHPILFHNPRLVMAEVCLTYLNFDYVRNLPLTHCEGLEAVAFVQYASCYWGKHLGEGISESVKRLALRLLDVYYKHASSQLLLSHELGWRYHHWGKGRIFEGFTGLHCVAYFGLRELVVALLEAKEWDVNAIDARGGTAIAWATEMGHEGVVKVLLERSDTDPDTVDREGRTPLSRAAEAGHQEVVKVLLERGDVNPSAADSGGQTPLSKAAVGGHADIVKALLERSDVNPNTVDRWGQSSLLRAAVGGHVEVVKVLLERSDVNPSAADSGGQTPLSKAAVGGHADIVKVLLERSDVNPSTADSGGQTPLSKAAEGGRAEVVKVLLKRNDVNPDTVDGWGQSLLSRAVMGGHAEVVKVLLERSDVNPNTMDKQGRTPLLWAMKRGHERLVMMLLERNDVNPGMVDKRGRTPLSRVMNRGHERLAMMLLKRNDVNLDTVDVEDRTPLLWAASCGYESVLKTLLERNDVNPNTVYKGGRTPLLWAAERGHAGVVKMLLEQNDVNPDMADEDGRTPLSWAAERGYPSVMITLLRRNEVDPNRADGRGRTPLSWAAESGHGEFLMFLKRNRPLPSLSSGEKRTHPFSTEISRPPHPPKRARRL